MKQRFIIKVLGGILAIALIIFIYKFFVAPHVSLAKIRAHEAYITALLAAHYWFSIFCFMIVYMIIVFFMLPITLVLNIAAGYFYGVVPATILCIVSASTGALLSMLTFRYLLSGFAQRMYGGKLDAFRQNFKKNGISYLIALQLLPVTPYPLITASAGLSGISARVFFFTTLIGIMPGTLIYTLAGRSFATIDETQSLLSWHLVALLCLLSLLALLPSLVRLYTNKREAKNHS